MVQDNSWHLTYSYQFETSLRITESISRKKNFKFAQVSLFWRFWLTMHTHIHTTACTLSSITSLSCLLAAEAQATTVFSSRSLSTKKPKECTCSSPNFRFGGRRWRPKKERPRRRGVQKDTSCRCIWLFLLLPTLLWAEPEEEKEEY